MYFSYPALPGPAGPGLENGLHVRHGGSESPRRRETRRPRVRRRTRTGTPSGSVRGRADVARREAPHDGERTPREAVRRARRRAVSVDSPPRAPGEIEPISHGLQSIECTRPLQLGQHSIQTVGLLAHVLPEENRSRRRRSAPASRPATPRGTGTLRRGVPRRSLPRGRSPPRHDEAPGSARRGRAASRGRRPRPLSTATMGPKKLTQPGARREREEHREVRAAEMDLRALARSQGSRCRSTRADP